MTNAGLTVAENWEPASRSVLRRFECGAAATDEMPRLKSSRRRTPVSALAAILAVVTATGGQASAAGQTWQDAVDYTKLKSRVGASLPTGAGGMVSLVEVANGNKQYTLDPGNSEFTAASDPFGVGLSLTDGTVPPVAGATVHATSTVGANFFGNTASLAPGANSATIYELYYWLDNVLGQFSSTPPLPQPYRVQNHSWIATTLGSSSQDQSVLRRCDYLIETSDMTGVVGANNGTGAQPHLLVSSYNGIVVGKTDGSHSRGATDLVYGGGRFKPDIVAPGSNPSTGTSPTSAATARVSSAATMLYESGAGTDATRSETMKAILLAGATKQEFASYLDPVTNTVQPWNHTQNRPLDEIFGAGELNVYNSYLIQQGGKRPGSPTTPASSVPAFGWDYQDNKANATVGDMLYNFTVPAGSTAQELSIILAWNAKVVDTDNSPSNFSPQQSLQNLDLKLLNSVGTVIDQSVSTLDNVEHIYQTNLAPGAYTLKVTGSANWDYGLAWRMNTLFDQPSADFDGNGVVDGADFLTWQRNTGTLLGATHAQGDANGDGSIDVDDLAFLAAAGVSAASQALPAAGGSVVAGSVGGIHGVPEPTALGMLAMSGFLFAAGRMPRRRQRG
jgi:hypothetical protein